MRMHMLMHMLMRTLKLKSTPLMMAMAMVLAMAMVKVLAMDQVSCLLRKHLQPLRLTVDMRLVVEPSMARRLCPKLIHPWKPIPIPIPIPRLRLPVLRRDSCHPSLPGIVVPTPQGPCCDYAALWMPISCSQQGHGWAIQGCTH